MASANHSSRMNVRNQRCYRLVFLHVCILASICSHCYGFQIHSAAVPSRTIHKSPKWGSSIVPRQSSCRLCPQGRVRVARLCMSPVMSRFVPRASSCKAKSTGTSGLDENTSVKHPLFNHLSQKIKHNYTLLQSLWWNLRTFLRKFIQGTTIYVLECEHGKYYIGSTTHKRQRFRQHWSARGGSKWTKFHKPVRVMQQYRRIPAKYALGMEAKVTAEYMYKYGVNNVRGAMFAHWEEYTLNDLEKLVGFLGHFNGLSYNDVRQELQKSLPPASIETNSSTASSRISRTTKRRKNKKKRRN